MSERRSLGGATWVRCSKCRRRLYTKTALIKHTELLCLGVYPIIEALGDPYAAEIGLPPANTPLANPKTSKAASSSNKIYIYGAFMREARLKTKGWVQVSQHLGDEGEVPVALQVWPLLNTVPFYPKAVLSASAFMTNCTLVKDKAYKIVPFTEARSLDYAEELEINVEGSPGALDSERLGSTFKSHFKFRPVALGNKFVIEFYASLVTVQITSIIPHGGVPFDQLSFYQILEKTKVIIKFIQDQNAQNEDEELAVVTFEDVGGLKDQSQEILDTIDFMTNANNSAAKVPRGILIFGHYGTGKSLLVDAICNTLGFKKVIIDEGGMSKRRFQGTPLEQIVSEKFSEALKCESGAALILDNLDASRSDERVSVAKILRAQMDRISARDSKVVLIATTSNLDSVDPILRSPQVFCKEIELPVPSVTQRSEILQAILLGFTIRLSDQNINSIAAATHGFVGADLKGLCTEAALHNHGIIDLQSLSRALKTVRPSALKSILVDVPNVRWSDIGGMEDLKFKLKQSIEWPLKHPDSFTRFGITPPKGVLMYGPPGCSKTMIAKAVATESGLNFLSVKGSELFSKWVGESEKSVQKIFQRARQVAPCIIFFDEIDSLGGERGQNGSSNVHERVLAQLLVEIDGIEALQDVTIIAATNRPDLIDKALTRPGRIDRLIYVSLPDENTRREILTIRLSKMPAAEVDVEFLVGLTVGYSGAEISALCQEAALKAMEENIEAVEIRPDHFMYALTIVNRRTTSETVAFYEGFERDLRK